MVEHKLAKFWFSQTHWSYAQIIFPAGPASQGGKCLKKDAAMEQRAFKM